MASLPYDRIASVSQIKEHEWKQLTDYHQSKSCLMKELTSALDDPLAENCATVQIVYLAARFLLMLNVNEYSLQLIL